jgi:hypothetical protein
MPADTVVNALNNIKSILLKCTNDGGNEDRRAIQKLHALFRTKSNGNIAFKKVTFLDLPAIPTCNTPTTTVDKTVQHTDMVKAPRVIIRPNKAATPRVATAIVNKPMGVGKQNEWQEMWTRCAKQLNTILQQQRPVAMRSQTQTHITDLAKAMLVMENNMFAKTANAIFDE